MYACLPTDRSVYRLTHSSVVKILPLLSDAEGSSSLRPLHWALDNATDPNGPPEILPFDVSSVRTLADKYELVTTEAAFLAAAQATALASEQQQQLRAGQARVVSIEEVVDSGDDFFAAAFTDHRCLWTMVDSFKVFARMSPQGKGLMIRAIQTTDPLAHVLMCGDGGNDVGALKQAAVGIALLVRAPLHFAFCILHFALCTFHFYPPTSLENHVYSVTLCLSVSLKGRSL